MTIEFLQDRFGVIVAILVLITIGAGMVTYFWKLKCESCNMKLSKHYYNDKRLCDACYRKEQTAVREEEEMKRNLQLAKEKMDAADARTQEEIERSEQIKKLVE